MHVDKLAVDAAIYIPPDVASQTMSFGRALLAGYANKWDLLVGDSLRSYSEKYFGQVFETVTTYNSKESIYENKQLMFIIEPLVQDIQSSELECDIVLQCTIRDRQERVLYEGTGIGTSEGSHAITTSFYSPKKSIRRAFGTAMGNAFESLIDDLRSDGGWDTLKTITDAEAQI